MTNTPVTEDCVATEMMSVLAHKLRVTIEGNELGRTGGEVLDVAADPDALDAAAEAAEDADATDAREALDADAADALEAAAALDTASGAGSPPVGGST